MDGEQWNYDTSRRRRKTRFDKPTNKHLNYALLSLMSMRKKIVMFIDKSDSTSFGFSLSSPSSKIGPFMNLSLPQAGIIVEAKKSVGGNRMKGQRRGKNHTQTACHSVNDQQREKDAETIHKTHPSERSFVRPLSPS